MSRRRTADTSGRNRELSRRWSRGTEPDSPNPRHSDVVREYTRKGSQGRKHRRDHTISRCEYCMSTVLLLGSSHSGAKLKASNCFDVVGGVSEIEVQLLSSLPPADRTFIIFTWILRLMVARIGDGGLAIPPPLLSRTYQVLSDSMAASQQALKLSHTPFPYPLRQLLALLLLAFQVLVPMAVAAFVDSPPLVGAVCFFVCLGYMALNETARELEHPFGLGANHLPTVEYQEAFNAKISRLLDLTVPELGYVPRQSPSEEAAEAALNEATCSCRGLSPSPSPPPPPPTAPERRNSPFTWPFSPAPAASTPAVEPAAAAVGDDDFV